MQPDPRPFAVRCAWCDRLRDGDGAWRFGVRADPDRVTHGMRPTCLAIQLAAWKVNLPAPPEPGPSGRPG